MSSELFGALPPTSFGTFLWAWAVKLVPATVLVPVFPTLRDFPFPIPFPADGPVVLIIVLSHRFPWQNGASRGIRIVESSTHRSSVGNFRSPYSIWRKWYEVLSLSLLMGLVGAAASATAAPITYNINFTGGTPNPTSGSFTYDSAAALGSQFTGFNVLWSGFSFDLTAEANSPIASSGGPGCPASPTSTTFFSILSGNSVCSGAPSNQWSGFAGPPGVEYFLICQGTGGGVGCNTVGRIAARSDLLLSFSGVVNASGEFTISTATPEPSSLALLLGGGVWLAWQRRRRDALSRNVTTEPGGRS